MSQAVRSPRHGDEPLFFDGSAINHTGAESPVVDSFQRVPHFLQHRPVGIGFSEPLLLQLVSGTLIADIMSALVNRLACVDHRPLDPGGHLSFFY